MATLIATVTLTFQTESYGRKANWLRAATKLSSAGGSQEAKKLFLNGLYSGSLVAMLETSINAG